MPIATIDGIPTYFETLGDGPPLLMFSPGGFDATLDKWSSLGIYARTRPLEHLSRHYTCIVFDRRETGRSGGRVERITWADYATQGRGLLDHLGIERAALMGGCMGCGPVTAFAARHPERVRAMVLYWPVGGASYRLSSQLRFAQHLAYVQEHGLAGVAELAAQTGKPFNADPRGGPWATVLARRDAFAQDYVRQDVPRYQALVAALARTLIDRDTAPGAEPEDLLALDVPALIVPGSDASHTTSAARYLQECLARSVYWDAPVERQTEAATAEQLLRFLQSA